MQGSCKHSEESRVLVTVWAPQCPREDGPCPRELGPNPPVRKRARKPRPAPRTEPSAGPDPPVALLRVLDRLQQATNNAPRPQVLRPRAQSRVKQSFSSPRIHREILRIVYADTLSLYKSFEEQDGDKEIKINSGRLLSVRGESSGVRSGPPASLQLCVPGQAEPPVRDPVSVRTATRPSCQEVSGAGHCWPWLSRVVFSMQVPPLPPPLGPPHPAPRSVPDRLRPHRGRLRLWLNLSRAAVFAAMPNVAIREACFSRSSARPLSRVL